VTDTRLVPTGDRWRRLVWYLATASLIAAGLASLPHVFSTARSLPAIGGSSWATAAVAGVVAVVLSGIVLGALALLTERRPVLGLIAALAFLAVTRLMAVYLIDAARVSDWANYHQLALGWLRGAPPLADIPMGYPIALATVYGLGGIGVGSAEALNVLVSVLVGGVLAYGIREVAGARAAVIAVVILALSPSQLLFTPIAGSDMLFCLVIAAAVVLAVRGLVELTGHRLRVALTAAAALGLVLGVGTYVRPTALVLLPLLATLPLVAGIRWRRALPLTLAIGVAAGLALLPLLAWNRIMLDRWSISPSLYVGWQLYIGANVEAGGRHNDADVRRADALPPGQTHVPREYAAGRFDRVLLQAMVERDARMADLAVTRLAANFRALPGLAVVKFEHGWAPADNPVQYTVGVGQDPVRTPSALARFLAQLWWTAVLGTASAWFITERRNPPLGLAVGVVVIAITATLIVFEAKPRYHEYTVPLLAGIAGVAISASSRVRGRRPVSRDGSEPGLA
jgi:hypothetical protein